MLEQEPSLDSLQPLAKSEEPEAAAAAALQPPVSQASGSFSDVGYSSGHGSYGRGGSDGDRGCSSFCGSDSARGEMGVDSSVGGGSGGASSGDAAVAGAHAPVAPAAGREGGSAAKHGGSPRNGSAAGPVHGGLANPTAQQLSSGQVSFSDFYSCWQESEARQARRRALGEDRHRGAGTGMEAIGQDMSRRIDPSAEKEACRFLADLGREFALHPRDVWLNVL